MMRSDMLICFLFLSIIKISQIDCVIQLNTNSLGQGTDGRSRVAFKPDTNQLIVGGQFQNVGFQTPANSSYLALFNLSNNVWIPFGNEPIGANVEAIIVNPLNNDVFIGGEFDMIGNNSMKRIAKFNGTWNHLGGGGGLLSSGNAIVYEFLFHSTTSMLFIAGDFDSGVDTLPTASHIVKYDPIADQFIAMGTGASSAVFCLAQDPTNNFIYLGGSFSIINGNNWPFFAAYDVVGDTFSRIGTVDLDNWVWSIAVSPSGKIYIGGQMTGGVLYFNGTEFQTFNGGQTTNDAIRKLSFCGNSEDLLWVAGRFSTIFGTAAGNLALVNVSNPQSAVILKAFAPSSGPEIRTLFCMANNVDYYLGGEFVYVDGVSSNNTAHFRLSNVCLPNEFQCQDGSCKSSLIACYTNVPQVCSNVTKPFWCSRLSSCVSSVGECSISGGCQAPLFSCWDGTCVDFRSQCVAVPACPANTRRCNDGFCNTTCAPGISSCFPSGICPDLSCFNSTVACAPYDGCAVGFIKCPNSASCVLQISECTASTLTKCYDGSFVNSALNQTCPLDPSQLKIIEVHFANIPVDQPINISIPTLYDNQNTLTMTAPANAFTANCTFTLWLRPLADSLIESALSNDSRIPSGSGFQIEVSACVSLVGIVYFDIRLPSAPNPNGTYCFSFLNTTINRFQCVDSNVSFYNITDTNSQVVTWFMRASTPHFTEFLPIVDLPPPSQQATETNNELTNSSSVVDLTVIVAVAVSLAALIILVGIILIVVYVVRRRTFSGERETAKQEQSMLIALNDKSDTKIKQDEIRIIKELGAGKFGAVFKGEYHGNFVALKKLLKEDEKGFEAEVEVLKQLRNPNIVWYIGLWRNDKGEEFIVTEFVNGGDLRSLLRSDKLKPLKKIDVALDAAIGMAYLHGKKLIHRDLAARNLLVQKEENDKLIIKVADFGLTVNSNAKIDSDTFFALRWAAPETLKSQTFNASTDIFAFAMTMIEIWTDGDTPFAEKNNKAVFEDIPKGERPNQPDLCPNSIFKLMMQCWDGNPALRGSFDSIVEKLKEIRSEFS